MSFSRFLAKKTKINAGFSLGQLLVVMAIVTIVLTSLIVQQGKWNDQLAVGSQAYELALMIRQAQVYGLGVREYGAGSGDKFDVGYGIHFDSNTPSQYIFFVDRDKDRIYDAGEALETKTFTRGVTVNRFCDVTVAGVETCTGGNIRRLGLSFMRPDPKANILFLNNGGSPSPGAGNLRAFVYLRSPSGRESSVRIEGNGQVSIIQ